MSKDLKEERVHQVGIWEKSVQAEGILGSKVGACLECLRDSKGADVTGTE